MKKLLLFFTVITLGLSMTSCLEGGSQNFNEAYIVYISQYQGTVYGKTLNGRLITSDKMMLMQPGTFKYFNYSWDESYGFTTIGDMSAYKVMIGNDIIDVSQSYATPSIAPEEKPDVRFENIKAPLYDELGQYFDDFWLFEFSYKGVEGETPNLTFYIRDNDESSNSINVDIRLTKTGQGKEGATEKTFTDVTAVNMSYIRQAYLSSSTNEVEIKFYYYVSGNEEPISSQTYKMRKASSSN